MKHTNITAREIRLLAVLSLIAGIVFDYLFYRKAIGVSYLLFVVVFYCLFWIASRRQISFQIGFGWFSVYTHFSALSCIRHLFKPGVADPQFYPDPTAPFPSNDAACL